MASCLFQFFGPSPHFGLFQILGQSEKPLHFFCCCSNAIPRSIIFASSWSEVFFRYSLTACFIIYERELLLSKYTLNNDLEAVFSLKCIMLQTVHARTNMTDYPPHVAGSKKETGANLTYRPSVFSIVSCGERKAVNRSH